MDTSALLQKLASDLLFDPIRLRIAEQTARPLLDHVAEYRAFLAAKGSGRHHVNDTSRRVRLMVRLCRARVWSQLTPATMQTALAKLRAVRDRRLTLGPATVNHYLQSLKSFCRWMSHDGRAPHNPAIGLRGFNTHVDVRRRRRSLGRDEVLKLIDAANRGPTIGGIPGAERALMYTLACTTGLRAGELCSLTAASFVLTGDNPHVIVEAAYSKHRRRDTVPLRADVATMVAVHLRDRSDGRKLFRRPMGHGTRALKADLAKAGIPYKMAEGYADFHALRHTFVTNLFENGATPKEAQTLARHQDARLTLGRYAHVTAAQQRAAVERLPSIGAEGGLAESGSGPNGRSQSHVSGATGNRTPIC